MFNSSELRDELQALKADVARLVNRTGEGIFDSARQRGDALADQIKAALNDLGDAVSEGEDQVGALIAERPVAALASAFALGVIVGLMLRRH